MSGSLRPVGRDAMRRAACILMVILFAVSAGRAEPPGSSTTKTDGEAPAPPEPEVGSVVQRVILFLFGALLALAAGTAAVSLLKPRRRREAP